ncbi:hypothetical protein DP44_3853 [Burkholderia pseudomallei]|nr:hypothetical protein DP44_3853 [Burkholderia pseudomallei]
MRIRRAGHRHLAQRHPTYRMTFSLFRKRNTLSSPKFHPISIASQWHSRLAHQTRKGGQIAHYLTNPV